MAKVHKWEVMECVETEETLLGAFFDVERPHEGR
jgi:hypothetical protein